MNDPCIVCNQAKYEMHSPEPPHASLPPASPCPGYANTMGAEGPEYVPGGGGSGGGGSSGEW
jgi:hypothetical protein